MYIIYNRENEQVFCNPLTEEPYTFGTEDQAYAMMADYNLDGEVIFDENLLPF